MLNRLTSEQFAILFPRACAWAMEQERLILEKGVPLTEQQLIDAKKIGVASPEQVRLLKVDRIPLPTDPELASVARETGLFSGNTIARTLRYGIFIRADKWEQRLLVAHEMVHTMQYERLGGFEGFLRPYLLECYYLPGYPNGPLEREAIVTSQNICAPD